MSQTRTPPPRLVLEWDFSQSHRVAELDWPDASRNQRFWKGDLQLALKLPGGRMLQISLADARAERTGEQIHVLELRGHPQTLDEAVAEVERRMRELDLPRRDFDEWQADIRSRDFRKDRVFATRRNDLTPTLSLEVKHTYDEAAPWFLSWEIAWPALVSPANRP